MSHLDRLLQHVAQLVDGEARAEQAHQDSLLHLRQAEEAQRRAEAAVSKAAAIDNAHALTDAEYRRLMRDLDALEQEIRRLEGPHP